MRLLRKLNNPVPYLKGITILYSVSFLAGIVLSDRIEPFVSGFLNGILSQVKTKTYFETALLIFANNARAATLSVLLGPAFAIYPLFATSLNGLILGSAASAAWSKNPALLLRIIPHGIFELPAILLSFALGTKTGVEVIMPPRKNRSRKQELANNMKESFLILLKIILPAIFIASLIESALIK